MGAWTSRPSSMFGGKISDHLDKDGVNKFVRWSVEEIERTGEGLRTDALYRASGGHDDVQRIRGQPERGMQELLRQETNVHVLTGALKQFFRSLKQPILSIEEFQDVLESRENGTDASDKLVDIINNVPKLQRPTLAFFFKHLFRVMHELDNNMSLASLGVVFGPTLMRVAVSVLSEDVTRVQARIEDLNLVVELLLQHYSKVFNDYSCVVDDVTVSCGTQDEGVQTLPYTDGQLETKDISNGEVDSEGDDNKLPTSKDSDAQLSSDTKPTTENLVGCHEAEEVSSGALLDAPSNQQSECGSPDERDDLEGLSRTSSSGETPSLATLTDHTTRKSSSVSLTFSGEVDKDSEDVTTHPTSATTREAAILDDSSSDTDDIDSVLTHMAKALTPDHEVSDVDRRSSSVSTASRGSCDVTPVEARDTKKDSLYRLSPSRISIIERESSTAAGEASKEESAPGHEGTIESENKATDETDMSSVEDRIRLFAKVGDNVASVKKQKVIGNQESEEDKKVKTEFEETFEKVTQQKSN